MGATLRGAVAGVLAAGLLAGVLALVAYQTALSPSAVGWALRVLGLVVSVAAGWVAGRSAPSGAVLHGVLAAVTVTVIGHLAAAIGGWSVGALWSALLSATVFGAVGALLAAVG